MRTLYVITLRPAPGGDGLRAIKALLKLAWRVFKLKCLSITTKDDGR